ncbi:MAG: RNA polymerase sigma-54 factor, partial [Porphyromonas pasteri]
MNKLTQQQKLDQSLSLTPAQIQAIKMLELTGLELEARIERELEENPALEENDEAPQQEGSDDEATSSDSDDQDWELGEYATEDDIPDYKLRELQERQSVREEIPFAAGAPSLDEYLMEQLALVTPLEGTRREIARYIIGNIDDDGYLTRSVEEIEDDLLFKAGLSVTPEEIAELIRLVKTLDPAGIGARDLRESLLLQIERLPAAPLHREAQRMIEHHYEDFVNKRFDRLC